MIAKRMSCINVLVVDLRPSLHNTLSACSSLSDSFLGHGCENSAGHYAHSWTRETSLSIALTGYPEWFVRCSSNKCGCLDARQRDAARPRIAGLKLQHRFVFCSCGIAM